MRFLRLTGALVLVSFCLIDTPREISASYAQPQLTVSSYWHRMVERRHGMALDCFLDAGPADPSTMLVLPDMVELRCRDFRILDRGRGQVDVAYRVEYRVSMGDSLAHFETGDRLHLTSRGWKIANPLLFVRNDE